MFDIDLKKLIMVVQEFLKFQVIVVALALIFILIGSRKFAGKITTI